jgi:hypothetical protein
VHVARRRDALHGPFVHGSIALGCATLVVFALGFGTGRPTPAAARSAVSVPCTPPEARPHATTSVTTPDQHAIEAVAPPRDATGSQPIGVTVPEGRLYLEPAHLTIWVPASSDELVLPDVLVADLRRDEPGWELAMTVTSVREQGHEEPASIEVLPGQPRVIVGRGGVEPGSRAGVEVGGCIVLSSAPAGGGWGSYFQTANLRLRHGHGDLEIVVDLHLISAS